MSRALASRYQPVLVALHWVLALMILGLLCLGFFVLANMPNTDPQKLDILVWHMTGGMFVLALMILRVNQPAYDAQLRPPRQSVRRFLDRLASIAHAGLYAIVFLMIASGWFTGWLISGSFQRNGPPLPQSSRCFRLSGPCNYLAVTSSHSDRSSHRSRALPPFVLKDGLFRRISFCERRLFPSKT